MNTDRLTYKIAVAYYENGLTQQQIANRYGISRIKVSRLLSSAIKNKTVQINILPPEDPYTELEQKLEKKYNLDEVLIVENDNDGNWLERAGRASANLFNKNLTGNETIGITWGSSLSSFVNNLPSIYYPDIKIVQMVGGLGEPQAEYHGAELARRMAQTYGSRSLLLQAPGIVPDKEVCKTLKDHLQVKTILDQTENIDIAVVGIGLFADNAPLTKPESALLPEDIAQLKKLDVVGDISLRFFNRKGEFIDNEINERVIGISIEHYKKIKRRIAIVGGKDKYETIKAALNKRLITVLITDSLTATKLKEEK